MGKRICVFCASSNRIAPHYVEAAVQFARLAVVQGHHIVCGGTSKGLMDTLIGATIEAGGRIDGVVPKFMHDYGWTDRRLTHVTVAETMSERKELLIKGSDAIVSLPGAIGTLEELTQAISLKRLGRYHNPIIILNQNGFYDSLLHFFDKMGSERMMAQGRTAWRVVNHVEDILPAIEAEPPWDADLLHYHDSENYGN